MTNVNHKDLTTTALHEPKGVAGASANTMYGADGAGSGAWAKVDADNINTSSIKNLNQQSVTVTFEDISTGSSQFVVIPLAGDITKIWTVIDGAIITADAGMSFEIAGTPITNGGITITQSGSAAGDVDSSSPSGAQTVTAGQAIEMISDGASGNTVNAKITFEVDVT